VYCIAHISTTYSGIQYSKSYVHCLVDISNTYLYTKSYVYCRVHISTTTTGILYTKSYVYCRVHVSHTSTGILHTKSYVYRIVDISNTYLYTKSHVYLKVHISKTCLRTCVCKIMSISTATGLEFVTRIKTILYSRFQIWWPKILRLFLKTFNLVPGEPGFSLHLSLVLCYCLVLIFNRMSRILVG